MNFEDVYLVAGSIFFIVGTFFFVLIVIILFIMLLKVISMEKKIKDVSNRASCMLRSFEDISHNLGFKLINSFFKGRRKDED